MGEFLKGYWFWMVKRYVNQFKARWLSSQMAAVVGPLALHRYRHRHHSHPHCRWTELASHLSIAENYRGGRRLDSFLPTTLHTDPEEGL